MHDGCRRPDERISHPQGRQNRLQPLLRQISWHAQQVPETRAARCAEFLLRSIVLAANAARNPGHASGRSQCRLLRGVCINPERKTEGISRFGSGEGRICRSEKNDLAAREWRKNPYRKFSKVQSNPFILQAPRCLCKCLLFAGRFSSHLR